MLGTLKHHPQFDSAYVPARNVDVWLPPGYDEGSARYPVLYMHDGQNLFDPDLAFIGEAWEVQHTIERLARAGRIPPTIVVGMWNDVERWRDYMPARPFDVEDGPAFMARHRDKLGDGPRSEGYLRFIVEEVKPFIDATYPTRPEREHTLVMGSSMGGLISLYAVCRYPEVFGGAGCLSTHWIAAEGIAMDYFAEALPAPGRHRLYFDHGTETLDAHYAPYQLRIDALMRAAGYTSGEDWITRIFQGADHSEPAWRKRVHIPLEFLLGGTKIV